MSTASIPTTPGALGPLTVGDDSGDLFARLVDQEGYEKANHLWEEGRRWFVADARRTAYNQMNLAIDAGDFDAASEHARTLGFWIGAVEGRPWFDIANQLALFADDDSGIDLDELRNDIAELGNDIE